MPPLFPERASTMAGRVDALYFFLLALSAFFALLIAGLIVYFAIKYRRRAPDSIGERIHGGTALEVTWTVVPFIITMGIFVWGASVYFAMATPPEDTLNIYVVGKQWMWKFQHLDGQREINELHVPVGRNVKLITTSEDVIHDFFVPAFRMKADVLPGRYVSLWFHPTRPGRYQLFCAEYCGTQHSKMIGEVVVMDPTEYQTWLSGGAPEGSLASSGEKLFQDLACITCHRGDAQGRGPVLQGLFGKTVALQNGETVVADEAYIRESILTPGVKITAGFQPIMPAFQDLACITCHRGDAQGRGPVLQGLFGKTVALQNGESIVADEAYIRESILNPGAKITAGFQPIMPAFQGLVSEEQLLALIEYVKSLGTQPQVEPARPTPSGPAAGEATPVKDKSEK